MNADKGVKMGGEGGRQALYIFIPSSLVLISRLLIVGTLLTRASTDFLEKG